MVATGRYQKNKRSSRQLRLTEVIAKFLDREVAYGKVLNTDGTVLWSYTLPIGMWEEGCVCLPPVEMWYTRTTLRHRNMLRDMATSRNIPILNQTEHGSQQFVLYRQQKDQAVMPNVALTIVLDLWLVKNLNQVLSPRQFCMHPNGTYRWPLQWATFLDYQKANSLGIEKENKCPL